MQVKLWKYRKFCSYQSITVFLNKQNIREILKKSASKFIETLNKHVSKISSSKNCASTLLNIYEGRSIFKMANEWNEGIFHIIKEVKISLWRRPNFCHKFVKVTIIFTNNLYQSKSTKFVQITLEVSEELIDLKNCLMFNKVSSTI